MHIGKIRVKKGQRTDFSQTKKIQNIVKNILQSKIEQIKKNANLLENILAQVKKRKGLFEKGLKKMPKEELIISFLKSKQSIAELFNNNLDDDKISDIKRILSRLRDKLPQKYRKEIKKKLYEIENKENLSEAEKE